MSSSTVLVPTESLDRRLSIETIAARRTAIFQLMQKAMNKGIDFGTVPGTERPTLFKAGAEKLCALFQLAPRVQVNDLSTPDTIRYQVKVELYTTSGVFVAEGIGAASTAESKYQWRSAVCREEFDLTPEDRRRVVYKRKRDGGHYTILQVRTVPEDAENTIIKMSKKRALVDAVLTATAASDIFQQDIVDDDHDDDDDDDDENHPTTPHKPGSEPPQPAAKGNISEPQAKRFYAIATREGKFSDDQIKQFLHQRYGVQNIRELTQREDYDSACAWASGQRPQPQPQPPSQQQRPSAQQQREREPGDDDLEPDQGIPFGKQF